MLAYSNINKVKIKYRNCKYQQRLLFKTMLQDLCWFKIHKKEFKLR